jgi:hypothetical protein
MSVLSIILLGLYYSTNSIKYASTFINESTNVSLNTSLPSNEFNALWGFYEALNGDNWYWLRKRSIGKRCGILVSGTLTLVLVVLQL